MRGSGATVNYPAGRIVSMRCDRVGPEWSDAVERLCVWANRLTTTILRVFGFLDWC